MRSEDINMENRAKELSKQVIKEVLSESLDEKNIKKMAEEVAERAVYKILNRGKDWRFQNTKLLMKNYKNLKQHILNDKDEIKLYISDNILFNLPQKLDYIYDDQNIAIIFKPQGILSNDETKNSDEPTLESLVKKENPNYIICHRLDRNTAGLVIFAKNDIAYASILSGFKNNSIIKEYIAYVSGSNFKNKEETLNQYISLNKKDGISKIYEKNNEKNSLKSITTSYEVIYTNTKRDYSILKVFIHNGKTHQIRAVLSNISHPIIGDSKYGKNEINKKFNKYRQLLFAVKYKFNFDSSSKLSYLNNKDIILDKSYYSNYIGDNL